MTTGSLTFCLSHTTHSLLPGTNSVWGGSWGSQPPKSCLLQRKPSCSTTICGSQTTADQINYLPATPAPWHITDIWSGASSSTHHHKTPSNVIYTKFSSIPCNHKPPIQSNLYVWNCSLWIAPSHIFNTKGHQYNKVKSLHCQDGGEVFLHRMKMIKDAVIEHKVLCLLSLY